MRTRSRLVRVLLVLVAVALAVGWLIRRAAVQLVRPAGRTAPGRPRRSGTPGTRGYPGAEVHQLIPATTGSASVSRATAPADEAADPAESAQAVPIGQPASGHGGVRRGGLRAVAPLPPTRPTLVADLPATPEPAAESGSGVEPELAAGSGSGVEQRDDLRRIKGVGPAIERSLHEAGIHSYRQLATLDADGLGQVRVSLRDFRRRIEREDWVGQARELHREKYGEFPS